MSSVVTAITGEGGLQPATFYTETAQLAPLIVLMVPIALGVYFLRKLVKGMGKAKVRF